MEIAAADTADSSILDETEEEGSDVADLLILLGIAVLIALVILGVLAYFGLVERMMRIRD